MAVGVSVHLASGLSARLGLLVMMGNDSAFSWGTYRWSWAMREVGEWSTEEPKVESENFLGEVLLSLPLRGSSFCRRDLS